MGRIKEKRNEKEVKQEREEKEEEGKKRSSWKEGSNISSVYNWFVKLHVFLFFILYRLYK